MHGEGAAKRRAIHELLFFAASGDLSRCQKLVSSWRLDLSQTDVCDYDGRTPLHLAASEGSWGVTEWLLSRGSPVNALDRFKRTPLEDAVRGNFVETAMLLIEYQAQIFNAEKGELVSLADSNLRGRVNLQALGLSPTFESLDLEPEWEMDPRDLEVLEKVGQGEFGTVFKARWKVCAVWW